MEWKLYLSTYILLAFAGDGTRNRWTKSARTKTLPPRVILMRPLSHLTVPLIDSDWFFLEWFVSVVGRANLLETRCPDQSLLPLSSWCSSRVSRETRMYMHTFSCEDARCMISIYISTMCLRLWQYYGFLHCRAITVRV
jgi:hypothetical protein